MSRPQDSIGIGLLLLGIAAHSGCATPTPQSTLTLEHHTFRVPLAIDEDGVARLTEHQPLLGRIELRSILEAEGLPVDSIATPNLQLLVHYGRFYVVADSFRAVWEISPEPGTSRAFYRSIPIVIEASAPRMKGVRLSRYGPAGLSCVRIDQADGPTFFISSKGTADASCW